MKKNISKFFKWLDGKGRKHLAFVIVLQTAIMAFCFSDRFTGDNLADVIKWALGIYVTGNAATHIANNRGGDNR